MTKLKDKVLKVLQSSKDSVVPYYATNTESHLKELSEAIKELSKLNIYPEFKSIEDEMVELDFVALPDEKLKVGKAVKFKETPEIESDYELGDKWFVKEVHHDLSEGYAVILSQFVDDNTVSISVYDESWEKLTETFEYIH